MKFKLLVLLLSANLISCVEVRDSEKKASPPETTASPAVEVRPLAQPQRYAVLIKSVSSSAQITRKSMSSLKFEQTSQVPTGSSEVEDVVELPGIYEYSISQNGKTTLVQVTIPKDYIISGDMNLAGFDAPVKREKGQYRVVETSGRIYFKAGSSLMTNGENLHLKADSIESEGALVQTFPLGQTAQPGQDGRHGGHVKLEARTLSGTLQVIMRGEAGGQAGSANWSSDDNNGRKGGNSGLLEVAIADQKMGDVTFLLQPGKASEGVEVYHMCLLHDCGRTLVKPKGTNGLDGIAQPPLGLK